MEGPFLGQVISFSQSTAVGLGQGAGVVLRLARNSSQR